MDMVHETEHRLAPPERREERDAVLHVDDEIDIGEVAPIGEGCPYVLAVGATCIDDRIGARRDRPTAQHGGLVTAVGEPECKAVDEDLRTSGLGVGQIAPGEKEDAHVRPPSSRGRRGSSTSPPRAARARAGSTAATGSTGERRR